MRKPTLNLANLIATVTILVSTRAEAAPPDLCEEPVLTVDGSVYQDSTGLTLSRWCEPHTDPPLWDGKVCCSLTDGVHCQAPTATGGCATGKAFHCEYGEAVGDDVVCYQPGPWACDLGLCGSYDSTNPEIFAATIWGCCVEKGINDLICTFAGVTNNGEPPASPCGGFLAICNWGQTNLDGSITCFG